MLMAIEKYKFHIIKTEFCGFIMELKKLSIDLKKIKAVINWQELSNITKLRLFLKFFNYYRRFIIQWLNNIKPFTKFIRKEEL